ncbi:ABC transporter permease [Plantactinospora mayteni]|uniref:Nitrate ABC transporter permease n=1 Tax=Plantactinospora mayteni TaxID=566021 RepID=A0ABQ4EPA6_9ACTN|nr:ABC transporter permease [Plantactinospora mayteni]GIG96504.1 nitrate ABC transporter permease [Plantactinospora mayteni]
MLRTGLRLLVPGLLVLLWWTTSAGSTSPFYPPLREVLAAFQESWLFARLGSDLVPSVTRLLAGLLIATVVGIAVGAALGRSRLLARALNPAVQFCRSVPGTALIPISVVLFGIGDGSKILVIAFVCVFPVLLNTVDAVRGVDPQLEDVARSYRLTPVQRLAFVLLPAAAPQIFAGIRTALGIAFIMMVVTELYAATNGVGFVTLSARNSFDVPQMWAGTVLLGLLGVALSALFLVLQRRVLRWHIGMTERN